MTRSCQTSFISNSLHFVASSTKIITKGQKSKKVTEQFNLHWKFWAQASKGSSAFLSSPEILDISSKREKKQLGNTFMTVLSLAGMRNLITGSLHRLSLAEVHLWRSLFLFLLKKLKAFYLKVEVMAKVIWPFWDNVSSKDERIIISSKSKQPIKVLWHSCTIFAKFYTSEIWS